MSGYNNNFPDMLGVFFAYGPCEFTKLSFPRFSQLSINSITAFKKSVKRGTCRLIDVHSLICHILGLSTCEKGDGNFSRNNDILLKSNSCTMKCSFVILVSSIIVVLSNLHV